MTDDIDKLLAQVKAEMNQPPPSEQPLPPSGKPSYFQGSELEEDITSDKALRGLLDDVKLESAQPHRSTGQPPAMPSPPPVPDRSLDGLLGDLQSELTQKHHSVQPHQPRSSWQPSAMPSPPPVSDKGLEGLLGDLHSEFTEKEKAEALQREQQRLEEARRQEQQRLEEARRQEQLAQQRRQELERYAVEWLKKLDPWSDEGFWFGQFAEKYPDRLEAAIAYLDAMQQNQPPT